MNNIDLYGAKCTRLLELLETNKYKNIIPPIFPIDKFFASEFMKTIDTSKEVLYDDIVDSFSAYYKKNKSNLVEKIENKIGDMPWIIRSSGDEDSDTNPNAGRFESIVCESSDAFFTNLAKVIFSGYTDFSLLHSRLGNDNKFVTDKHTIAAFVQTLIGCEKKNTVDRNKNKVPYINNKAVKDLYCKIVSLHTYLGIERLDCEWVIESDEGSVSATSMTVKKSDGKIEGQVAFGFDLFSTQHVESSHNSMLFLLSDGETHLWQKNCFCELSNYRYWIVQVRPAVGYNLCINEITLSPKTVINLSKNPQWTSVKCEEVIIFGSIIKAGAYIKAQTLNQAWNVFLKMPQCDREKVTCVFFENGTRTEHAGIMFSQTGLSVCKINLKNIPSYATISIIDGEREECYFGTESSIADIHFETTKSTRLALPSNCALVFTHYDSKELSNLFAQENITSNLDDKVNFSTKALISSSIPSLILDKLNRFDISEKNKNNIIENSIYPSIDFLIKSTHEVYSPTALHQILTFITMNNIALAKIIDDLCPFLNEQSMQYAHSFLVVYGMLDSKAVLPRLSAINSSCILHLSVLKQIEIVWNLIVLEQSEINDSVLEKLLSKLAHTSIKQSKDINKEVMCILSTMIKFSDSVNKLKIFHPNETLKMYELLGTAIYNANNYSELRNINILCNDTLLSPYYMVDVIDDLEFYQMYGKLKDDITRFENIFSDYKVIDIANNLNNNYIYLKNYLKDKNKAVGINNTIYTEIVEMYDITAKNLLDSISQHNNAMVMKCYLELLMEWLLFIAIHTDEKKIIETLNEWITIQIMEVNTYENFFLKEIHWKLYLDEAAMYRAEKLNIDNPHQIHNVLHQWSLSLMPSIPVDELAQEIQRMLTFANTFCEQENRLLRFQKDLFEIELSMCTHKASFTFLDNNVQVEFSEPPEVEDGEIGRLVAFDGFLNKFSNWFDNYKFLHHYEKVVGSWTFFATIKTFDGFIFLADDYMSILYTMRFLFDGSYDFSHTSVEDIGIISSRFEDPQWKDIVIDLIKYRKVFDDFHQHIDLKSYVLSRILTELCLSTELEAYMFNCYTESFEYCVNKMIKIGSDLENSNDFAEWNIIFKSIGLLALILASKWPRETLANINQFMPYSYICKVICKNLFIRADIKEMLKQIIVDNPEDLNLIDLILHYAPDIIITAKNVISIADYLKQKDKQFKFAKQFMLNMYSSKLSVDLRTAIANDLDCIPYGCTSKEEKALQVVIKSVKRFKINNTISFLE